MGFWAEVRNDFFESAADILPEEGDVLAKVAIDAWKTDDENEEGCGIACVMLSKHGDVLVDYRDGVARIDEMAQEAIGEAKRRLKDYYQELVDEREQLNEIKSDLIVYFGEGQFVEREHLRQVVVDAAESFAAKVFDENGDAKAERSSYLIGSPAAEFELEIVCEYRKATQSWWTVCSLWSKGANADFVGSLDVASVGDVTDIAETCLELLEELDGFIEIEFVEVMHSVLCMAKPLEEAVHSAEKRSEVPKAGGKKPELEF